MTTVKERYEIAKEVYAAIGVDTDKALQALKQIPISMHCWQGDDVIGFDGGGALSGGIQTTGNYPGRARTPQELMADIDKALSLIPGKHRLNLHASYAIFQDGEHVDRDKLEQVCQECAGEGVCTISNYNCPGQLVIAGDKAAVDAACTLAKERGARRCLPL